jgi:hypothetical protein
MSSADYDDIVLFSKGHPSFILAVYATLLAAEPGLSSDCHASIKQGSG